MTNQTDILSKFPGPVVLASRKINMRYLLLSLVFVAGIAFLLLKYPGDGWQSAKLGAAGAFFLLGAFFFAAIMLPGASELKLDRDGFEITNFFRKRRVNWKNTTDFKVWTLRSHSTVTYNDATAKTTWLTRLNAMLSLHNTGLPQTYGLDGQVLADVMNRWRERALRP